MKRFFSYNNRNDYKKVDVQSLTYGEVPGTGKYSITDYGVITAETPTTGRGYFRYYIGNIQKGDVIKVKFAVRKLSGASPRVAFDYANTNYGASEIHSSPPNKFHNTDWEVKEITHIAITNAKFVTFIIGVVGGEVSKFQISPVTVEMTTVLGSDSGRQATFTNGSGDWSSNLYSICDEVTFVKKDTNTLQVKFRQLPCHIYPVAIAGLVQSSQYIVPKTVRQSVTSASNVVELEFIKSDGSVIPLANIPDNSVFCIKMDLY